MDYSQAIAFLQSFPDSERGLPGAKPTRHLKMSLSTMVSFLESLDNPQNHAKTIHITGSKGKGSTATFITSILNKAGFRTALFTSPHLHSYTERIAFDLEPVSQAVFAQEITDLKPYIEAFDKQGQTISTFGILTALFFHLVSKAVPPIDWQIVEVGLGGKDDVTNVFTEKEAAVITSISLEHTAILGHTKQAIAENKAGIITPGSLVVLAPQEDRNVLDTVKKTCIEKNARLINVDNVSSANPIMTLPLKMPGEHQLTNALTAATLAQALSEKEAKISKKVIEEGLASAFLPGRFEVIESKNISSITVPVILDGAHNDDSAKALAKTLAAVFPDQSVLFILGTNQDKNLEDIWLALKPRACAVITTCANSHRAIPPEELIKRIISCDAKANTIYSENIDQALEKAENYLINNNNHDKVICICGSLYLVAEARERLLSAYSHTTTR